MKHKLLASDRPLTKWLDRIRIQEPNNVDLTITSLTNIPSDEARTLKTIFEANRQLTKVRIIMLTSLPCAAVSIWMGFNLAQTYGLSSGDGGVLAPLSVRLAWAAGVSLLGISFAVAMWLYGKCYIAKLDIDEQAEVLTIHTVRFFGTTKQEVALSRITGLHYNEGYLALPDAPTVHAPWWTIRIEGRNLPFILDHQGKFSEQMRPSLSLE